jgi:hypothetical protein
MTMRKTAFIVTCVWLAATQLFALGDRGSPVTEAIIYISPDASSSKLARAGRGRELVILDTTEKWLHVEALLSDPRPDIEYAVNEDEDEGKTVTGWIMKRDVILASTPNGDKILFGEAVDSEDQASQAHGRPGAAQDAQRLYYRVADLFPASPLAADAMYRSADIRWQVEKADIMSKPSAREQDAFLRGEIDEHWMKEVIKKFPGTKWADLAAFHLIDNKLCGNWQGAAKCPIREAEIYERYADDHPESPASPEALYEAAWRWAALIEIYKTDGDEKKSAEAKSKAIDLAQKGAAQFTRSDWGSRAHKLLYLLQQGIPAYGNVED